MVFMLVELKSILNSYSVHFYGCQLESCFWFYKQTKQDSKNADGNMKTSEDELTCTICLEQVNRGELVRSLPCLHQVFPLAPKSHHCLPKILDFIQQLILSTVLLIIWGLTCFTWITYESGMLTLPPLPNLWL